MAWIQCSPPLQHTKISTPKIPSSFTNRFGHSIDMNVPYGQLVAFE